MVSADKRKKNHDSEKEWNYGGVKRRDFRHSKDGPEVINGRGKKKERKNLLRCHKSPDEKHLVQSYRRYSFSFDMKTFCVYCGTYFSRKEIKNNFFKRIDPVVGDPDLAIVYRRWWTEEEE